ncbi:MAG: CRTAC1 family protein [Acidobacteriaceae bacterium]
MDHHLSRRRFLRLAQAASLGLAAESLLGSGFVQRAQSKPIFSAVPPEKSGITFRHNSGRSTEYYLPETTGGGCAFLDYDNDGWMDIYLINSGKSDFYDPHPPLRNALYKNNRDGTFTDVTVKAGVLGGGYGMGIAVGDYNADGFPDIFLAQYGRSILYRNNGDGTFSDVTHSSGVITEGWASSAVWFDYDNDGRLDLFVCGFVQFDKAKNKFCGDAPTGERFYCIPRVYPPGRSWLFHNNGNGTFTDVTAESGILKYPTKAWGVVAADVNKDGLMDLFVANDTLPNFLFLNRGKGKFEEVGLTSNVGFSQDGRSRSGMGVDAADLNENGWPDLFVTNVDQEMYSLYRNNRDETFDDLAAQMNIASATRLMSGWGVKFFDYDNDGFLDLLIANGHPDDKVEKHVHGVSYAEPLLLYHNNGVTLENVSTSAGPAFQQKLAARGLAIGDFDNDGAVDALVAVNNGCPVLLKNTASTGNHWLGLRLLGKTCNRDAIGARVLWKAGGRSHSRVTVGGGSFLASHDPRIVLGLGNAKRIEQLEIRWPAPSTRVDIFADLPIDRYAVIAEGQGPNR